MDRNEILANLHNRFSSLPQNALLTIHKALSERIKCARKKCDKRPCSLGIVFNNREDKIQFIRDDLNKESLDDIILTLEMHPSGYVQGAILQLWSFFQNEYTRYSLENLTINDHVCQFIRKLDGKPILDP